MGSTLKTILVLPSTFQVPKLELKEPLEELKYTFLEDNNGFPVIISFALDSNQLEKLVTLLRKHKGTIGWTIADLKGIS